MTKLSPGPRDLGWYDVDLSDYANAGALPMPGMSAWLPAVEAQPLFIHVDRSAPVRRQPPEEPPWFERFRMAVARWLWPAGQMVDF